MTPSPDQIRQAIKNQKMHPNMHQKIFNALQHIKFCQIQEHINRELKKPAANGLQSTSNKMDNGINYGTQP